MWFFFSSNLAYGEEALNFLENIPGKKCFIVTDKVLEELGIVKILTDRLDKLGKEYEIFTDVKSDPHEDDIMKGKEECIAYKPDIVIGLGGGSAMDSAKAIYAMYEYPEYKIDDFHPWNPDFYDLGKKAKMVCIPTTSGTGAETTWAIVVSRLQDDVWIKLEQAHKGIVPDYAILDPIFTLEMPKKLTAATGFDALAHSLEGITSGWKNEFSDALALKAVELIFNYLPIAYEDGSNFEARDMMHQAAAIAGQSFGNSQAHIGHALGHSLAAIYHTHHGEAVGLFLPYVLQYNINDPNEANKSADILGKFAKQLGWAKWDNDNKEAANIVIEKVKELQNKVNLSTTIKDLGISREDLGNNTEKIVELCLQSGCTTMSSRVPGVEDFTKLLQYAYDGLDVDF
jgi:acetaldehyde dehydrogenase/alcohol dehydrogenase